MKIDTAKNEMEVRVTTVKAKEDVQMGNYMWDVRNDPEIAGSQSLTLRWIGE